MQLEAVNQSALGIASFGGRSLAENVKSAEVAIAKMAAVEAIHTGPHSQFMWRNMNLSWWSIHHNAKQLSAEIAKKREALTEAKCRFAEKQADVAVKQAEIEVEREVAIACDAGSAKAKLSLAKIGRLEVDIERIQTEAANSFKYIEGAVKDVLTLEKLYDELLAANGGPFTEEAYEDAEQASQVMRVFSQALRDIRSNGRIHNGNQEFLEQCGVNVTSAFIDCNEYLKDEGASCGVGGLHKFLFAMAEKYAGNGVEAAAMRGFSGVARQDAMR